MARLQGLRYVFRRRAVLEYVQSGPANPLLPPGHDSHMVTHWDNGLGKHVAILRDRTGYIQHVRKRLITDAVAPRVE